MCIRDRSTNTKENLDFSLEKIGDLNKSVGVVTNNFHVFRGVAIGKKCGCRDICGIPSRYRSWRLLIYIPREILAVIKDKIMGNLWFYSHNTGIMISAAGKSKRSVKGAILISFCAQWRKVNNIYSFSYGTKSLSGIRSCLSISESTAFSFLHMPVSL